MRHVGGADRDGAGEAHRDGGGSHGGDANLCERGYIANERKRSEPSHWTRGRSKPSNRNVEEGPDDHGIEVGAGARQQFSASVLRRHRRLVTANRSHDVVGVRNGNDTRTQRYLLPDQTPWVTATVVLLVVLSHRVSPLTKPTRQRRGQLRSFQGMILDLLPFVFVEGAWFVQNVGMDGDLADVVKESRPTESIPIGLGQFHFVGDEVRVHANPFTVAARLTVVHV